MKCSPMPSRWAGYAYDRLRRTLVLREIPNFFCGYLTGFDITTGQRERVRGRLRGVGWCGVGRTAESSPHAPHTPLSPHTFHALAFLGCSGR
ncbi:MAG: hypothetical protein F6J93_31010 [Oscillatoria sp. SIO1A7]|nr:hypothetical protein [Oscillatoria sp. SIO1A7]